MGKSIFLAMVSVVYLLQPCLVDGQGFTSCTYSSNCSGYTNLGIINLNNASSVNPYQTTDKITGIWYRWKSCEDFTSGGITAGAIKEPLGYYGLDVGVHRQASCLADSGYVKFSMMSTDMMRISYVRCLCGSGNVLQFESENPAFTYNLNFTSNACCPESGDTSTSTSPSSATSSPTPATSSPTPATSSPTPATSSPASRADTLNITEGTTLVIIFSSLIAMLLVCGTLFLVAMNRILKRRRTAYISL